jgi:selenocysteine-specific elongation factor
MTSLVVGTAGHIDHGKSTLVQALTGIDPDRLKEEKARGITIELGFAHATIGETTVAFVDVPGHERFVRTMLAGAGGVDCVLLVVAADESVMPQTREHFDICRLLQVEHGIIVITKADAADADTRELVRLEVRDLVAGSFLEHAPIVTVSARTGEGLEDLRQALAQVAARAAARESGGPARLPIDRVFTMAGFGTVVTGTMVSGRVAVDDELALVPGDLRVRVRGVQVHGRKRDNALSGQRAAVNVGGIEVASIARGQSLITPNSLTLTRRIDATLDLLPTARPLKHGARVHFHQGTAELLGRVSLAGSRHEVQPGTRINVRLRLESAAAVTRGDRFILRAYSPTVTIGGGEILDPEPPRAGVRAEAAEERFRELAGDEPRAFLRMITDAGPLGVALSALTSRAGRTPAQAAAVASEIEAGGSAQRVGDRLVASLAIDSLSAQLLALIGAFHKAEPLADGMPREEARERLFARAHPAIFEHVVQRLSAGHQLVARERLALPGHRLELPPEEAQARDLLERALLDGGLKPPDVATVAAERHVRPLIAEKMTALLLRQKRLVRLGTLVFHSDALQGLKAEIQALKSAVPDGQATVDVGMFKDRFGVSRKFAIPLLEWLDRERVTRRVGEKRIVL